MRLSNPMRGEVTVTLGRQAVRLCVTLGALARMEGHFGVSGFEALSEKLKTIGPADLGVVLEALALDALPEPDRIALPEALAAIVAAFEALHE